MTVEMMEYFEVATTVEMLETLTVENLDCAKVAMLESVLVAHLVVQMAFSMAVLRAAWKD